MKDWDVLAVHYSGGALTTTACELRVPMRWMTASNNFSLGYDALGSYADKDKYWKAVHDELRVVWRRPGTPIFKDPDLVIVTGNAASDPTFQEVLRDAVKARKPKIMDNDAVLAAAKGTADWYLRYRVRVDTDSPKQLVNQPMDL
jgi:hypothetical protein